MRHNAGLNALCSALEVKRAFARAKEARLEYTRKEFETAQLEAKEAQLAVKQIEEMLAAVTNLASAFSATAKGETDAKDS